MTDPRPAPTGSALRAMASRVGPHLRAWGELYLAGVGYAVFLVLSAPGKLNPDSASQLCQGRAGFYEDWHTPFVAWLMAALDGLIKGPLLMHLTCSAVYLFGVTVVLRRLLRPGGLRWLAVALAVFNPVVWTAYFATNKDLWSVAFLILALGIYVYRDARPRWARWAGLVGLVVAGFGACGSRYNAVLVFVPLVILTLDALPWWRRLALSAAVIAVSLVAAMGVNRGLTTVHTYPIQQIYLYDVWGISNAVGRPLMKTTHPQLLAKHGSAAVLNLYRPDSNVQLVWDPRFRDDVLTRDPARVARFRSHWLRSVLRHPLAYLKVRREIFAYLLHVKRPSGSLQLGPTNRFRYECWVYRVGKCNNRCKEDFGRQVWPGNGLRWQRGREAYLTVVNPWLDGFWFSGGFVLLGLLAGVGLWGFGLGGGFVRGVTLIMGLDLAGLFVSAPAFDRRYLLFSMVLATLLLARAPRWIRQRLAPPPPAPG